MIVKIAEILACLAETYISFYFLNKFFEQKNICNFKIRTITTLLFTITVLEDIFISEVRNYEIFSMFLFCLITFIYSVIFLKGKIQYKALLCVINVVIHSVIIIFTLSLFSVFTDKNNLEIINNDNYIRIITLFADKIIYFICVNLVLRFTKNKNHNLNFIEWIIILVIFIVSYIALLTLWQLSRDSNLKYSPLVITSSISLGLISILVYFLLNKLSDNNYLREEYNLLKLKNQTEIKIYSEISSQYEELNCLRHDLSHHLTVIFDFAENNKSDKICEYISNLRNFNISINPDDTVYTKNNIIDLVLNNKIYLAKQNNIPFKFKINITSIDKITEYSNQIGTVLANLLDNAINASIESEIKTIELKIYNVNDFIVIIVKNRVNFNIISDNPNLRTSKRDKNKHGFGLLSVKSIVNKCNGTFEIKTTDDYFIANVVI
ncbi:MAG: GHKL domain-containing protein [Oscillospiraceae bacterium]|jgi:signal transduction histidine kinase|nr:GHKL domain-containing protein [Oscillospiraceae bacterium]